MNMQESRRFGIWARAGEVDLIFSKEHVSHTSIWTQA